MRLIIATIKVHTCMYKRYIKVATQSVNMQRTWNSSNMSPILKFCLINVSYVHCIYIDNFTQANIPESGLHPVSKRSWVLILDVQKCITKMYVHCISVVLLFTLYYMSHIKF